MIAAWLAAGGTAHAGVAELGFMAVARRQHRLATRPDADALIPVAA